MELDFSVQKPILIDMEDTQGIPEPIDQEQLTEIIRVETMQELVYGVDND